MSTITITERQRSILRDVFTLIESLDRYFEVVRDEPEVRSTETFTSDARTLRALLEAWSGILASQVMMTPGLVRRQAAM